MKDYIKMAFPLKSIVVLLQVSVIFAEAQSKQPNIIIILADDVGWNDFSLHGSNQIPTPNIDALGYNGVILDKFYTQQSCTPSRSALLTGKYPIRTGLQGNPITAGENRSLPLGEPTIADRLKGLGYATHLVGKWHLGFACEEETPTKRGFDTHFGYWNGFVGYFSYQIATADPRNSSRNLTGFDLIDGFEPQWGLKGQYATELFTKKSLEIIEKHDTNTPLFLFLSHLAGHAGENGTELGVPNASRTDELYNYIPSNERRSYADLINLMDQSVGDVVAKLSQRGMLENSIILFFSDNGPQTEGKFLNYGSAWPFRGLKMTLFEGGVRGTAALYSPLLQKKNYINKELIHITDLLPTLYRAAGGNLADLGEIDGIDQWDVVSKGISTNRTELLVNIDEKVGYSGILGYKGQYKLLNGTYPKDNGYYGEDGRGQENPAYNLNSVLNSPTNKAIQNLTCTKAMSEPLIKKLRDEITLGNCRPPNAPQTISCDKLCLFDIFSDPCESKNLIDNKDMADVIDELKKKLHGFIAEVVPQTNRPVDSNSDPAKFNGTWHQWLECSSDSIHQESAIQSIRNGFLKFINNFKFM